MILDYNPEKDIVIMTNLRQMDFIRPTCDLFRWKNNSVRIGQGMLLELVLNPHLDNLYNNILNLYSPHKKLKELVISGNYINFDTDEICTADFILKNINVSDIEISFENKRNFV